jgi:hypothetical protein
MIMAISGQLPPLSQDRFSRLGVELICALSCLSLTTALSLLSWHIAPWVGMLAAFIWTKIAFGRFGLELRRSRASEVAEPMGISDPPQDAQLANAYRRSGRMKVRCRRQGT